MATPKYSSLPDIDLSAKEIFETPDIVAKDPIALRRDYDRGSGLYGDDHDYDDDVQEDDDDEGELEIVKGSVSLSVAASRFMPQNEQGEVDHSGRISSMKHRNFKRLRRKGGPALPERDDYTILLAPNAYEPETKLQRLRRLMFEVEQLEVDLKKGSEEVELTVPAGQDGEEVVVSDDKAVEKSASEERQGKKKGKYGHKILIQQVNHLQDELSRISKRMDGGLDPVVFTEGDTAVGSLVRQTEYQKALIAHLNAFKSDSKSKEESAAAEPTQPDSLKTTTNQPRSDMVTYELFFTPENARLAQLSKVADLEKRLTNVERLVGVHLLQGMEAGDDGLTSILQTSGNVVGALERLEHHLALLTQPRHLDNVSRRVKTVTAEMERLLELRKKQQQEHQNARFLSAGSAASAVSDLDMHATQTETERKVDYLFASLDKLDPLIGVIPHLISRLHALRGLHTEASVFSDSLRLVDDEQKKVVETTKTMEEAIKGLEKSIEVNSERVQKNFESLHSRIASIVEKIEKTQIVEK
ncbi:hypothetical protein HDU67_008964 [Dinochytrium kinnereticum]|nr:hypothetical protein HDU67_008964 [Dinochytrium kinnereticum]